MYFLSIHRTGSSAVAFVGKGFSSDQHGLSFTIDFANNIKKTRFRFFAERSDAANPKSCSIRLLGVFPIYIWLLRVECVRCATALLYQRVLDSIDHVRNSITADIGESSGDKADSVASDFKGF